ncbi:MAG TPA: MBOAT family protein [Herpetosiphonaceae bacterium]
MPSPGAAALLFASLAALLFGVFPALRLRQPGRRALLGWAILLAAGGAALWASQGWHGWARLVATWLAAFVGFKALALLGADPAVTDRLDFWRFWGFAGAWLGMELGPWTRPAEPRPLPGAGRMVGEGLAMLIGWLALALALARTPLLPPLAQAWCVLVAVIIGVFFGASRALTGAWRALGRDVAPPFDQPVYATSLADWWGRRWNLAVHAVLNQAIWQPARRWGVWPATALVFGASGLLHEYLISYPAGGGYGLPLLYFAIQALGMRAERTRALRRLLKRSGLARAGWTLGVTLLPGPLLFHPPLLDALIRPWLG